MTTHALKKRKTLSVTIVAYALWILVCLFSTRLFAWPWNENEILNDKSIENISCNDTDCFFPAMLGDKDISIEGEINWNKNKTLVLRTSKSIIFAAKGWVTKEGKLISKKGGSIILKAGIEPGDRNIYDSTIRFHGITPQIEIQGTGKVKIYYNPALGTKEYKYHNPTFYGNNILTDDKLEVYMLVNDVYDLQDMTACLYGGYALSQDIDASPTKDKNWGEGKGFFPIKDVEINIPFSGIFDGNHYTIKNLYINRPEETDVGLFGYVSGSNNYRCVIKNFNIEKAFISGNRCVGVVIGEAKGVSIDNVNVQDSSVYGKEDFGLGAGCVLVNEHGNLHVENTVAYKDGEEKTDAQFFGSCVACKNNTKS